MKHKMASVGVSNSYRNKSFDMGGSSHLSWPLPPSSVFKCKPAQPWIHPKFFYASSWSVKSTPFQTGILIAREAIPEGVSYHNRHRHSLSTEEEDFILDIYADEMKDDGLQEVEIEEPIYADAVILRRSSDRVNDYSKNFERGNDINDDNDKSISWILQKPISSESPIKVFQEIEAESDFDRRLFRKDEKNVAVQKKK